MPSQSIALALQAVLASPHFLFRRAAVPVRVNRVPCCLPTTSTLHRGLLLPLEQHAGRATAQAGLGRFSPPRWRLFEHKSCECCGIAGPAHWERTSPISG